MTAPTTGLSNVQAHLRKLFAVLPIRLESQVPHVHDEETPICSKGGRAQGQGTRQPAPSPQGHLVHSRLAHSSDTRAHRSSPGEQPTAREKALLPSPLFHIQLARPQSVLSPNHAVQVSCFLVILSALKINFRT